MITRKLQLCLVTHISNIPYASHKQFILEAIAGGVTSIQLRDKNVSLADFTRRAQELKHLLAPINIPLIINDHVDIAYQIDADGVHIGQTDGSPQAARDRLGPNKWIGLSIETLDELAIANQLSCIDYIGASAIFPSLSKNNCKTIWGLDGLKIITEQSRHPVVAIGGINVDNIEKIFACGVCGVAVINAIHGQKNPKIAAENLFHAMQGADHV